MDKQAFKERMKSLKSYRELNPDKGYWDWKVLAFDGGGDVNDKLYIGRTDQDYYGNLTHNIVVDANGDEVNFGLPDTVITPKNNLSLGTYNYNKEVAKNVADAVSFVPGVGEVIDATVAAQDASKGDYTTAAGLGLGLFIPNVIEKPAKLLWKRRKLAKEFAADPLLGELPAFSTKADKRIYTGDLDDVLSLESQYEFNDKFFINPEKASKAVTLARRDFLKKFNKWNKHYGYPPLDLNLSKDVSTMEEAIKERLIQHNTFVRGARDSNIDGRKAKTNQKLIEMGIAPTLDNRLKFYATTYTPETGSGRVGFTPRYPNEGVIYTSNSLNTAKGYAIPKEYEGKDTVGKMMKVRRHIDFEGNDYADWVNKADFAFANNRASTVWYQYELPYLMRTGKSLSSELILPAYLQYLKQFVEDKKVLSEEFYKYFYPKSMAAELKRVEHSWPVDVQTINSIFPETEQISLKINEWDAPITKKRKLLQMRDIRDAAETYLYQKSIDPLSDNLSSLARKIKVPIYRKDHYYKLANKDMQDRLNYYVKSNTDTRPPRYFDFVEDMKAALEREGILPNSVTDDIITSESMRKTTRNTGSAYLHFLFRGDIGEKGLDFVEFVDDAGDVDFYTRSHEGDWWPGYSRKSYADGGVVPAYTDGTDGDDDLRAQIINRANEVASNYDNAKDFDLSSAEYSLRKLAKNLFGRGGISNCTLSATGWIDPNNQYMSARNIFNNPNSGYVEIDKEYALPGDLLISKNPEKDSYHTMLVEGFNNNEPLLRYSRGGHDTEENLVKGRPLTEYHRLDNEQGGNHTEDHYFRYMLPNEFWLPEITITAPRKIKK